MKKMWKKVMTIILALVMTLGLGTSVQAAALNSGENTNSTNVQSQVCQQTRRLHSATYQVIKTKFDTAANELTYQLTDWAKAVLATGGKTEDDVIKEISKLNTTGTSATEQDNIVNQLAAAASKTAYSALWTVSSDKTTATANLPIGSYLVMASCTDMTFLNMLVSVNAKANTTDPNGWILEGEGAVLKGNPLSVDKKISERRHCFTDTY